MCTSAAFACGGFLWIAIENNPKPTCFSCDLSNRSCVTNTSGALDAASCTSACVGNSSLPSGVCSDNDKYLLSVAWMLPQYFFISMAEVLVAVPALEFAYTESTANSRGTMQAAWQILQGVGSTIAATVTIASQAQATVFFVYSGAMAGFCVIFIGLAVWYKFK